MLIGRWVSYGWWQLFRVNTVQCSHMQNRAFLKIKISWNKQVLLADLTVSIIYWQWHRAQPPINSKLIQSHSRSIWPRGSWSASYHFAMHGERRWSGTFKWSSCVRVRVAMCDDDLCMSLCVWERWERCEKRLFVIGIQRWQIWRPSTSTALQLCHHQGDEKIENTNYPR